MLHEPPLAHTPQLKQAGTVTSDLWRAAISLRLELISYVLGISGHLSPSGLFEELQWVFFNGQASR